MRRRLRVPLLLLAACAEHGRPPPDGPATAAVTAPAPAAPAAEKAQAAPAAPRVEVDEGAMDLFRASAVEGAFVLLDVRQNALTLINPEIASQGFLPASTFKIPNTLIGLETGVIPDERFSLRWDGKRRMLDDWNRDHDLASAMKFSVVWFYQEVARRIGQERMQRYVDAFSYGNRDISGGIDLFWLEGGMRISPREQVDFLRRLRAGALPVRPEHAALVQRLITLEERPGLVLRGKTGLTRDGDRTIGWLVGLVEKGDSTYVYATLVLGSQSDLERMIPLRRELTEKLLARRGVLPGGALTPKH